MSATNPEPSASSAPGRAEGAALAPGPTAAPEIALPALEGTDGPFLTVVVRTQGRRPQLLAETLASLSLQRDLDFEICVVLHHRGDRVGDAAAEATVRAVCGRAPSTAAHRIRLLVAPPGRRGVPLNTGIDAARGRYVAFLDDDDLARPDWVASFHAAANREPGRLIRARTSSQDVRRGTDGRDHEVLGQPVPRYQRNFDLLDHLHENQTPICALAWPIEAFRGDALGRDGVRVDETLVALEDWDLLLRVAPERGVLDVECVTSIFRWWVDDAGSKGEEQEAGWADARAQVRHHLGGRPLALHASEVAPLVHGADELAGFRRFSRELAAEVAARGGGDDIGDEDASLVKREFERLHTQLAAAYGASSNAYQQLDAERGELQRLASELERLRASPRALARAAMGASRRRARSLVRASLRLRP